MIHGCFWHGHSCKEGLRRPKSNQEYWIDKIYRNQLRDRKHLEKLEKAGWEIMVIWECELKNKEQITLEIQRFMTDIALGNSSQSKK